ncbi:deleted in malignant brain tumors 1 protein-like [Xyrichtys novacula]|uniref:Deleted in malignant brain tumors 1 protein-like n=1 Tax=Xyrichtys novacula TaxID=13765 RepID=A0AAV1HNM0_XYRNO|nr:deleted in malignant brain tumors 1 protein-like [Xyrichtys novacula]
MYLAGVPIRLSGSGSTQCSGRVEIFHNRIWGTVCDDRWDLNAAMVVCRQLGCGTALSAPTLAHFGEGTGPIWLDNVQCTGNQSSVFHCEHSEFGEHNCEHDEDAGVVCSGADIRLINSGVLGRCSGRVEIYHQGAWGTISDNGWDINDAKLVCRQLGCGTALSAPRFAHFGEGTGTIWLGDVACSGRESSLTECKHSGFGQHNYAHYRDAGVVCSAVSVTNVAPTGTAAQSGTQASYSASAAIDGSRNPVLVDGSCTLTDIGPIQWWSLLLPAVYRITHISITNRATESQRINNAEILIGNSQENNGNNNPRCVIIDSIKSGSTRTFNCGGMIGQVVNVKLKNPNEVLTLCEVEVYGEMAAPSFSAMVAGQSIEVVEKKLCWSDALFYCRDFYWDLLSIRSEEEQKEVEEVLKSVSFTLTQRVWFGLRRYLKGDTWFWMSGDSMNFTHSETHSVWENTSPCGAIDTSDHSSWTDFPCKEHLHFICLRDIQGNEERVEFFSSIRS